MPALVGEEWHDVDLEQFRGATLRTRSVVGSGADETTIVAQEPRSGETIDSSVMLTLRGPQETVPFDEVVDTLPAPVQVDFGGRAWRRAHTLEPGDLADGLTFDIPHGAMTVTWHCWLAEASAGPVSVEVTDDTGRRRQRTPVTARSAQRTRIAVTGGETLRITTDAISTVTVVLGDPTIEVLK